MALGDLALVESSVWMVMQVYLVPALLVGLFVWLVLESGRAGGLLVTPARMHDSNEQAIAIVTERYARGEIDRSEYERLVTAFSR